MRVFYIKYLSLWTVANMADRELINISIALKIFEMSIVSLQIYDTLGQEKFDSLTDAFYRQSNAIMFVYDVTNRRSFHNISRWMTRAYEHGCSFTPKTEAAFNGKYCILVGNKADLSLFERKVSYWEASLLALRFNMKYFETSVYDNRNIQEVFQNVVANYRLHGIGSEMPVDSEAHAQSFRLNNQRKLDHQKGFTGKCC